MHRCPCSSRALGAVLHDFAMLSTRPQGARFCQDVMRMRSSRRSASQLHSTAIPHPDDGLIAFDTPQSSPARASRKSSDEKELGSGKTGKFARRVGVVILDESPEDLVEERRSSEGATQAENLKEMPSTPTQTDVTPVQEQELTKSPKSVSNPPTVARQQRKRRRIEAGTFNPNRSQSTELEPSEKAQHDREKVLRKIAAMEGQMPSSSTRKSSEERKIAKDKKLAEKKAAAEQKRSARGQTPGKPPKEDWESKKEMLKEKYGGTAWQLQKAALKEKFGESGWQPRKRLSPDAIEGIRALHGLDPQTYTTAVLAEHFHVSPENLRRILRSKWQPNEEERQERRDRWEKRGLKKWTEMAEQGTKPPRMWRALGVGKVDRKAGEVPTWERRKSKGPRVERQARRAPRGRRDDDSNDWGDGKVVQQGDHQFSKKARSTRKTAEKAVR